MPNFLAMLVLWICVPVGAAVLNVEFKFTPFVGDPAKDEKVTTVAGQAAVFINNVPFSEQEVRVEQMPVLFDDHQVAPSVWVPMGSVGPVVRKGKNKIRIEFTPNDPAKSYRAQLRWASVMDETTEEAGPGTLHATNQANEGVDDRKALKGKVVMEHEFAGDFALDLPWHRYPPVNSLTEEEKQKIVALLQARAEWFKPDFAALYKAIDENESLKVDDIRKAQCLDEAYKAGVRLHPPQVGDLEFVTTGGPEVVVRRKEGTLFGLDAKTLSPLKDEDTQMCVGMALSLIYPGRVVAVGKPDGAWEIVY